jgi:deoxyribonuclease V
LKTTQNEQKNLGIDLPEGFSLEKARRIQAILSNKIITKDMLPQSLSYVAGIDAVYLNNWAFVSVVVMEYLGLKIVEAESIVARIYFPYVPTLLMFREVHPMINVLSKLKIKPDVCLIDGHGLAHPYRCGLASCVGVIANVPTVGVAKRLLCGSAGAPNEQNYAPIIDGENVVGAAVYPRPKFSPVYVSIGNKVCLDTAINIVKHCIKQYRLPEPIREAHKMANELRRQTLEETI